MIVDVYSSEQPLFYEGLKRAVKKLVSECDTCQKIEHDYCAQMGLMQLLLIPKGIWEDLTVDFVEGLTNSMGFETILSSQFLSQLAGGTAMLALDRVYLLLMTSDQYNSKKCRDQKHKDLAQPIENAIFLVLTDSTRSINQSKEAAR
ncbi:hypothetical protein Nepgr_002897 [Nepenthes gracilis]|uniref:Uncharacterized protein n=1 Tax=Nepenthes gracilis TaxID=150966 RepID=A0AAD3P9E3_NEPGR|nr:hypothetical protein Nepgr_002897 [Nepenthes gracilis]